MSIKKKSLKFKMFETIRLLKHISFENILLEITFFLTSDNIQYLIQLMFLRAI